ncbi:MAG: ATP-binding protein [Salibacter sp.]|uniref:ATP-binding protein n=1 Tax=Salibacter sp. TaxID=2010995 RepID=UPI00286FBB34|nr:ATP-binding protein [Salibacter sp.]MDR9399669.1 ATP-binding protein [Salibacter sp.]
MSLKKIKRDILPLVKKKLRPGKVLIILGARRVGKTELIKSILSEINQSEYLLLNGEDYTTIDLLSEQSQGNYDRLLKNINLLVIDEAQHIPEIGNKLKFIVDTYPALKVMVTGSSVFDVSQKLGEPLVGREITLKLHPLSQSEFSKTERLPETHDRLEERLIYGGYPELTQYDELDEKKDYLDSIVNAYLLKDILSFDGIKKSDKIMDLLRLIAFQIGKEVSIEELASQLKGISRNTVEHYLDLLTKVFVLYKVRAYSGNLRKEISKSSKWFFYDNGIRNAVIQNYAPLHLRQDKGELWENYIMTERLKFNSYTRRRVNSYFWRTYDQQEIDLIEEENGKLSAFEFKFNPNKKVKVPGGWKKGYPNADFQVIHPKNYLDFITSD